MGTCVSSCCHRHAKLSFGDKVVNLVLGYALPPARLGEEGLPKEERAQRLQTMRGMIRMEPATYEGSLNGHWEVLEAKAPRPEKSGGGAVSVLIHVRPAAEAGCEAVPLVIWAHGGGMTIGDYRERYAAHFFALLVKELGKSFCWASVQYRLAPEDPFPNAVDDMVAAYEMLKDPALAAACGYAPSRISMAGNSAGALLAGHTAVRLAQVGHVLEFLALMYPMVDPQMKGHCYKLYGDLPTLPVGWLRWSWSVLLAEASNQGDDGPSEARMRDGSLLHADWAAARGLRALVQLAQFDPMYEDGLELGHVLRAAGLEVEEVQGAGSHGVAHYFDKPARHGLLAWWAKAIAG